MARSFQRSSSARVSIRVHFNQLAPFADEPRDSAAEQTAENSHDGTDGARRTDPEALAGSLPADGARPGKDESPGPGGVRDAGAGGGPAVRPDDRQEDGLSGGLGDGAGGMGHPAGRGESEGDPVLAAEIVEPEQAPPVPARDFRIAEAHRIGQGGLKEKARDNIAAIRTLRLVEDEGRAPNEAEKAVLARYSGWGALSNVFHPYPRSDWAEIAGDVRSQMSPEEYDSARASTPNAHFTSPVVIGAMWASMERLGLGANAQILEPSMGVGHFFGLMPEALLPGCRRTGVELDTITARIAKQLYPDATIFAKGFEETALPNNFFDAVIGNIPFGNYGVHDPAYGKSPVTRAIHDYFLAKGLDKLRPGGVMALVTSRYTMDKQDSTIRRYLAERADLVAAIRLPKTAFKANAGTEVTTDILFLQKRAPGTAPSGVAPSHGRGETWRDLSTIDTPDGPVSVNEYFGRHPEMMLGTMRLEGSLYREREPALTGGLPPELLAQAVAALPEAPATARLSFWRKRSRRCRKASARTGP